MKSKKLIHGQTAASSASLGAIPIATLKTIASKFEKLRHFKANKRVDSEAIGAPDDRVLTRPGDDVEVIRWHCFDGPTSIIIRPASYGHDWIETCVPFSWVMEMGAPKELAQYMPFAPKTWVELLEEPATAVQKSETSQSSI